MSPTGNAKRPTPIKTFTELKIVCGEVDWPAKTVTMFPSPSSIFFNNTCDAVVANEIELLKLENEG